MLLFPANLVCAAAACCCALCVPRSFLCLVLNAPLRSVAPGTCGWAAPPQWDSGGTTPLHHHLPTTAQGLRLPSLPALSPPSSAYMLHFLHAYTYDYTTPPASSVLRFSPAIPACCCTVVLRLLLHFLLHWMPFLLPAAWVLPLPAASLLQVRSLRRMFYLPAGLRTTCAGWFCCRCALSALDGFCRTYLRVALVLPQSVCSPACCQNKAAAGTSLWMDILPRLSAMPVLAVHLLSSCRHTLLRCKACIAWLSVSWIGHFSFLSTTVQKWALPPAPLCIVFSPYAPAPSPTILRDIYTAYDTLFLRITGLAEHLPSASACGFVGFLHPLLCCVLLVRGSLHRAFCTSCLFLKFLSSLELLLHLHFHISWVLSLLPSLPFPTGATTPTTTHTPFPLPHLHGTSQPHRLQAWRGIVESPTLPPTTFYTATYIIPTLLTFHTTTPATTCTTNYLHLCTSHATHGRTMA